MIAISKPSSIIGTDLREPGYLRLDSTPRVEALSQTGIEYDNWRAMAQAVDMQTIPANVHKPPRSGIASVFAPDGNKLVNHAYQRGNQA